MKSDNVSLGQTYAVMVSGRLVPVQITSITPRGWLGLNCDTGRRVVIRNAARLRYEWGRLPIDRDRATDKALARLQRRVDKITPSERERATVGENRAAFSDPDALMTWGMFDQCLRVVASAEHGELRGELLHMAVVRYGAAGVKRARQTLCAIKAIFGIPQ